MQHFSNCRFVCGSVVEIRGKWLRVVQIICAKIPIIAGNPYTEGYLA